MSPLPHFGKLKLLRTWAESQYLFRLTLQCSRTQHPTGLYTRASHNIRQLPALHALLKHSRALSDTQHSPADNYQDLIHLHFILPDTEN